MYKNIMDLLENDNTFNNILLCSLQLGVNYNLWEDNKDIHNVLNIHKNTLAMRIKFFYPKLDEKSIKCITLAIYLYMYNEMLYNLFVV